MFDEVYRKMKIAVSLSQLDSKHAIGESVLTAAEITKVSDGQYMYTLMLDPEIYPGIHEKRQDIADYISERFGTSTVCVEPNKLVEGGVEYSICVN